MLNSKKCPAGRYCFGGLNNEAEAQDCSKGFYCPEGKVTETKLEAGKMRIFYVCANFICRYLIFIFILFSGTSKGFMTAFKAFIKPFEAPETSVKIKI